jgi:hypothetical protein
MENDPRSNTASATAVTFGDTTLTTTTTTDSTNLTTGEQSSDQRRDILPIVYDVQSIPTIGGGGITQINRGGIGRPRPSITSMFN